MYTKKLIKQLYTDMLRIRYCEESLVQPILNKEIIGPVHLYSGQEAIAVGICKNLERKDVVFGNHRSHGHYIAKGGDIRALISEIFCFENGCSKGRGGSMHIVDKACNMLGSAPIVGGTISLATGAALASKVRKDQSVSVCFFGDGATGEGVLFESMNFAALYNLPCIFVCENNLYSTHMSINECRPEVDIVKISDSFGICGVQVNGNDVLEVFKVAAKAICKAREGQGPVLIECQTYRQRGHVGPNDNIQGTQTDIRPDDEIKQWIEKDPIKQLENFINLNNILSQDELKKILQNVNYEIEEAHLALKDEKKPERSTVHNYVYK